MAAACTTSRRVAFVFPMASGHINPSLPIARALIRHGHEVHFQCREQMREAIEDTGAIFYNEIENVTEMYAGREPDLLGAFTSLKKEFHLENEHFMISYGKLYPIILELMVPGTVRFFEKVNPDVVVCCPLINKEAVQAAKFLGIPCVGLLTTAGPGSMAKAMLEMLKPTGLSIEELIEARGNFPVGRESGERFEAAYGYAPRHDDGLRPVGVLDAILHSTLTLVTTCEDLQDPTTQEMDDAYAGVGFETVGPLLDVQGAIRAAGHKFKDHHEGKNDDPNGRAALVRLQEARNAGRKVVLVSMGTVITGDSHDFGWDVKPPREGATDERQGLTGRELCQAAWGGAFHAFGAYGPDAEQAPLMLVALGPQAAALGELQVPDNALCMPVLPQVDLLKAGVDLFLTHGGQNSFTESLSQGAPVVVCPGFGDQPVNAQKAVDMGVGLQVERPSPADGEEADAAAAYSRAVSKALREVFGQPRFAAAAQACAKRLRAAGGVPRAVDLILGLAANGAAVHAPPSLPTLLARSVSPQKMQNVADVTTVIEADSCC